MDTDAAIDAFTLLNRAVRGLETGFFGLGIQFVGFV